MSIFKKHTLYQPFASVKEIETRVITIADYEPIYIKHLERDVETDQLMMDELIQVATGLELEQIVQLSMPDYNALEEAVKLQTSNSSEHFFKESGKDFNVEAPKLLDPLNGIEAIQYKVPNVRTSRNANEIKDDTREPLERTKYLIESCTQLTRLHIAKLSVRDFIMIQERITDFLQQEATFFQKSH